MPYTNLPESDSNVNDLAWFRALPDDEQVAVLDELFDRFMRQPEWERQQRLMQAQEEHCWRKHKLEALGVQSVIAWN